MLQSSPLKPMEAVQKRDQFSHQLYEMCQSLNNFHAAISSYLSYAMQRLKPSLRFVELQCVSKLERERRALFEVFCQNVN